MNGRAVLSVVVAVGVGLVAFPACGSSDRVPIARMASVPDDIVPKTVGDGLTLHEFPAARGAFARAGVTSLVADAKVWAIRRGETLVATLQVSTLKRDISVSSDADRRSIIGGVMTGAAYETIQFGDTQVIASTAAEKSLYLWFGPSMFEVLQVKSTKVDPDTVAADLLEYQQATGKIGRRAP
jgi:hypothetical protein